MTDAFLLDDDGVLTFTTLADDQNMITTPASSTDMPNIGKETLGETGETPAYPNSGSINSEAKNSKEGETGVRTEAVEAASGAEVPHDSMLSDAPAPPAVAGRTPDGEDGNAKDLESDDDRTSDSDDIVPPGMGMGDLADDTRNLMKEGVAGSSLTQPESRSPAAPRANAARESIDQDVAVPFEGSAIEMARVFGLRVEEHDKGIFFEDLAGSVLVNTDATLRLFGDGLSIESEVLFTAYPAEAGDMCGAHLSKAFKVSIAPAVVVFLH